MPSLGKRRSNCFEEEKINDEQRLSDFRHKLLSRAGLRVSLIPESEVGKMEPNHIKSDLFEIGCMDEILFHRCNQLQDPNIEILDGTQCSHVLPSCS